MRPSALGSSATIFRGVSLNADVTRYATWHGGHTLKAGLQFERMSNDVLLGAQKPAVILFWDASYFTTDGRTMRGKYGHYLVTRPYTEGDVRASNTGLFIQDAWTVTPRLTLNLGVRAENEHVPSYRPENPGIRFRVRRQDRAAGGLCLRRPRRQPVEAVRELGDLPRSDEAGRWPRDVWRRSRGGVLLHPRHGELAVHHVQPSSGVRT